MSGDNNTKEGLLNEWDAPASSNYDIHEETPAAAEVPAAQVVVAPEVKEPYVPAVLFFPDAPLRFNKESLNALLTWCSRNEVSDVTFKSGEAVFIKQHGRRIRATHRPLTTPEVGDIVNAVYGANGTARLAGGEDIDTSYGVKPDRDTRFRYRVNATSCDFEGNVGIEITMRTISSSPLDIKMFNLEPEIMAAIAPAMGLILITGETGSGKSTLLASILRYRIEQVDANLKVLTGEAPIEFVYDDIEKPSSLVTQTEIPRDLPSFARFAKGALRRDPDVILIGEARDPETIAAAIEISMTGHLTYSTVHSNSISSTARRMIAVFPEGERHGRAVDIIESLRLVVTQRLIKSTDGKRVAIREYLVFDDEIRDILLATDVEELPAVIRKLTKERGQTLEMDARKKLEAGRISQREFDAIASLSKREEIDASKALSDASFKIDWEK